MTSRQPPLRLGDEAPGGASRKMRKPNKIHWVKGPHRPNHTQRVLDLTGPPCSGPAYVLDNEYESKEEILSVVETQGKAPDPDCEWERLLNEHILEKAAARRRGEFDLETLLKQFKIEE